MPKYNKIS